MTTIPDVRDGLPGMAYPPIADYGLIGDLHSCALVSRDGSVDWCCFPRFDSRPAFSRILDWKRGGYFQVAPRGVFATTRRYLPLTNVLETTYETATGAATLTDVMPVHPHAHGRHADPTDTYQQIVRILECTRGEVHFEMHCRPRFDYGTIVPHASLEDARAGYAHGGSDALSVYSSAAMRVVDDAYVAAGTLRAGERFYASVTHEEQHSHDAETHDNAVLEARLRDTIKYWEEWSRICTYTGEYHEDVLRSALTLKALTYAPSGALLAAATTSLPEMIGGARNWDYRFTWIRDASFAVYALGILGYREEAAGFKDWLEWSTLGRARDLQPLYGIRGERRLTELELPLEGYRRSRPVRIGNGAATQFQLDIYGEIVDSAHLFRKFGGEVGGEYWEYLQRVVSYVIEHWREPDEGIWETRGGRRHFVFSKVMCWVALDRAIKAARAQDLAGDVERWRRVRAEIRDDVLTHGYDAERGSFVQHYQSKSLDASNLMLPLVGFIKATDPRMRDTIEATARELTSPDGFVYRYRDFDDGLAGTEGTFLICTFWLADNLIMLGEIGRARALFERCRASGNDLGLFSEEFDAQTGEMLGNFPQAFSHLGFINTAVQLEKAAAASPK